MAVTVSKVTADGADVEVILENGEILQGFVPAEFFEDTISDQASPEECIAWISENSDHVENTIKAKRDGGFVNSRFSSFQFRETK